MSQRILCAPGAAFAPSADAADGAGGGIADAQRTKRIVVTGGPGAGKTAVLEIIRRTLCARIAVLPEAASIVFGGGFPRRSDAASRRASQRAIFYVQRELEATAANGETPVVLCDRGTVDGAAYWPGPGDLWSSVGTTLDEQLARYDVVIHLRTPALQGGYNHENPLRTESAETARSIDDRILALWASHPCRYVVEAEVDFLSKATRAVQLLWNALPSCCRERDAPFDRSA